MFRIIILVSVFHVFFIRIFRHVPENLASSDRAVDIPSIGKVARLASHFNKCDKEMWQGIKERKLQTLIAVAKNRKMEKKVRKLNQNSYMGV